MFISLPSQEELYEYFSYNPYTGYFTRIKNTGRTARVGKIAGTLKSNGYYCIVFKGKEYRAHRLAWVYMYGREPIGEIDHINNNREDNRIANLREVTHAENQLNRIDTKRNGTFSDSYYWSRQVR